MVDVYAAQGQTSDLVTTAQNTAGVPTEILRVDPEDGTFVRFLNRVATGKSAGIPVYAKFKDSSGNDLALNSSFEFQARRAGHNSWSKVSEVVASIQYWNANSLTKQRNEENVDAVKVGLQYPEASSQTGAAPTVDVRDIDDFRVVLDSTDVIDWSNSSWYFDSDAVETHPRG